MKKGILLYTEYESRRNAFFISRLITCAEKRGIELRLVTAESNICKNADFVINRTDDHTFAKIFEEKGIRVFNSSYVSEVANSKYLSYKLALSLGIPVMPTEFGTDLCKNGFAFPLVVKPDFGKGGKNVYMVNSYDELAQAVSKINAPFVTQTAASDLGRDMRVYMIGKTPIAAMMRTSKTDFRSNFCLGGNAEVHALTEEERGFAVKIASELQSDYVGIDFIYDGGRPIFNEIEDAVGARMLYSNTDVDIADIYFEYVSQSI